MEDSDGKRHNLITRENYGFLRDSFFRYAYLMEKEAVHTPGRTFGEGIARLHEEMDDLVGEGLNVNIEEQDGRLPSLGKTDTVLFPDEIRGGSRTGIEAYLHHVHP